MEFVVIIAGILFWIGIVKTLLNAKPKGFFQRLTWFALWIVTLSFIFGNNNSSSNSNNTFFGGGCDPYDDMFDTDCYDAYDMFCEYDE